MYHEPLYPSLLHVTYLSPCHDNHRASMARTYTLLSLFSSLPARGTMFTADGQQPINLYILRPFQFAAPTGGWLKGSGGERESWGGGDDVSNDHLLRAREIKTGISHTQKAGPPSPHHPSFERFIRKRLLVYRYFHGLRLFVVS